MKRSTVWLLTAATLLVFVAAAWLAGRLLAVEGGDLWLLRGGLAVLGLIAALLVYLVLAPRAAAAAARAAATPAADDEVDQLIAAAQARLAASGVAGAGRLRNLPLVLVLGPSGSAKTTTVIRSGVEPELLAGEVHGGDGVVPTSAVNLWFTQGTVFLEVGGRTAADPNRWNRILRRIQPGRLGAVLSRGAQAPRVAVVCFGCDELLKPGAAESVPAAARTLRTQLLDAARQLGIRLPVYVIFTRTDRLPYFADFVRSLSREEASQVLGATLPATDPAAAGAYAEREAARLRDHFDALFRSLALRRLEVLPREQAEEVRAGGYEFPREFRKAADLANRFLVDLCRPNQLGASPFLRGFYFTGVRPIVVGDVAPAAPAAPATPAALDATSVFSVQALREAQRAPAPAGGGRRVPDWVFLPRIVRDVILGDHAAMRVTGGGSRVDLLRRALIGAAAALCFIAAVGMVVSFARNRSLERDALAAAEAVETADPAGAELPTADALSRLDSLREQAARLRGYQRDGRPWRLGWGLYTGGDLLPELRRLYFDRFERLIWRRTRTTLIAGLQDLPETPGETAEYGAVYDQLKAHLVTTSHPRESTPDFLAPVLLRNFTSGREVDEERLALAGRQFEFFAAELPEGNPYDHAPVDALVERTRLILRRFADVEPFYQALLADAAEDRPAIQFGRIVPGADATLRNDYAVPAAFTDSGWVAVHAGLERVDELLAREVWVVGERAVAPADRAALAAELRRRYRADYVRHWRAFVEAGAIVRPAGAADAARKLTLLGGNQSPLLQMLALASRHTDVDSTSVAPTFQPVHLVVPPGQTDRYIGDSNSAYMAALAGLQSATDQVASAAGPLRADAITQATGAAEKVQLEVQQLAQGFRIEGDARAVGNAVQRLLAAPVAGVEALLRALPSADINQGGQSFCRVMRPLTARYPFAPRATAEATVDEVAAVFKPGGSALWSFYDESLRDLLSVQGSRYAARAGANPAPSAAFVDFFNRAAELSRALYDESGAGPEVAFLFRPQTSDALPEIGVTIDGQTQRFTRTFAAARTFVWNGSRAGEARVTALVDGQEVALLDPPAGAWALFRLFQDAEWERLAAGRYRVSWRITGRSITLSADVTFARGVPVFMRDYLDRLDCVPRITR